MNCRICNGQLSKFLDLGQQPIANRFLLESEFDSEFFYQLEVGICNDCSMIQLVNLIPPDELFGQDYPFFSSTSTFMTNHFQMFADEIKAHLLPPDGFIVEVGCNDGTFLKNFTDFLHMGVDPSTLSNEFMALKEFFNKRTADWIVGMMGTADVVYAANTVCHIPDLNEFFQATRALLSPDGFLIFEDPYWGAIVRKGSFDQIYDEHVYYFTVTAIKNVVEMNGLRLLGVSPLETHGGSLRYYVGKQQKEIPGTGVTQAINRWSASEICTHLAKLSSFSKSVHLTRDKLRTLLSSLSGQIVGYGATSKSTTTLNYCGIGPDTLDYITDTTPDKQGKFSPGMHIPIVHPDKFYKDRPDYALLLAWNHITEILKKETEFRGKFVLYVPGVKIL